MNVYVIGWALVHSIWQGAAIAALVAVIFTMTRRQNPAVRYWIGLAGLALMVGLPVATAMRGNLGIGAGTDSPRNAFVGTQATLFADVIDASPAPEPAISGATEGNAPGQSRIFALPESITGFAESSLPWIVAAWFAGLLIASARLIGGISRTRQLTRRGVSKGSEKLEAAIARLSATLGIRGVVRVLESSRTAVPLVVGALRPVIVIPASLVTGLTPLQLDMLLTHELAHIRHHDFLVNLVQTVIETLLFYHPAVRWLSNRIREERENRCDDVAVAASGGNAHAYTETLLALEESRSPEIGLAAAATGGSLLRRARRLLLGEPAHIDIGPRWIAGIITIAAALFLARDAVGLGVQSSFTPVIPLESSEYTDTLDKAKRRNLPDPARGAPASVLRAPAGGTLEERWSWAEQRGRATGSSYWVGYLVAGDPTGKGRLYSDDVPVYISQGNVTLSGHMQFMDADFSGITFSGVPLRGILGDHLNASTAMFFLLSNGLTGRRIERLHVGSFAIPMYFDRKPLVWLDSASDRESIAMLRSLSSRARSDDMKRNIVGAIGAHYSPEAVPYLAELLASRTETDKIREEAAEWLGRRSTGPAMTALSRAARTDRSHDVREEAIEAFSHMDAPSATDTLIAFASSLATFDERKTAIEALGHRKDSRALDYLTRLATSEMDSNLPERAIEALGDMPDGMGYSRVVQIARTSPSAESRKNAIDAIGSSGKHGRPLEILQEIVRTDRNEDVIIAAVEAIADVHDRASVGILRDIARNGASEAIQRAAADALSSTVDNAAAMIALRSIVDDHPNYEVREQALESMIDMKGGAAIVQSIARTTKDAQLREIALEILDDHK